MFSTKDQKQGKDIHSSTLTQHQVEGPSQCNRRRKTRGYNGKGRSKTGMTVYVENPAESTKTVTETEFGNIAENQVNIQKSTVIYT